MGYQRTHPSSVYTPLLLMSRLEGFLVMGIVALAAKRPKGADRKKIFHAAGPQVSSIWLKVRAFDPHFVPVSPL